MMIRSTRIPPILDRICDDDMITSALLVTTDGELLGATSNINNKSNNNNNNISVESESFGTLLADIAVDYQRLGEEYATVDDNVHRSRSHMQFLLLEMELGLVGVSVCLGIDCLVVAVAKTDTPPGLLKGRLEALAVHVQESLSTLTEAA